LDDEVDLQIRLSAVEHLKRVKAAAVLSSDDLRAGFKFRGERMPLINPQRGIFKPASMEKLLSVRTVFPRATLTPSKIKPCDLNRLRART
jgi:putative restriction endonuclease